MTDTSVYRDALEARRTELQTRLGKIEGHLERPVDKDWEEQATEREDDEVLEDLGAAGLTELRQIEAALHRIEAGTYGICVNCGATIAPARLALLPHAARCVNCG